MDEAEFDVLTRISFPNAHHEQTHSTNPLDRLTAGTKRRTNMVGNFPNQPAITRSAGVPLLEQNNR